MATDVTRRDSQGGEANGKSKTNSGSGGEAVSEAERDAFSPTKRSDESGTADAADAESGTMTSLPTTTTVEPKSGSETVCHQRASEHTAEEEREGTETV